MFLRAAAPIALLLASIVGGAFASGDRGAAPIPGAPVVVAAPVSADSEGCMRCHEGIEDMHPGFPLSCVECHGGDGEAREKVRAHVQPSAPVATNERVLPENHDLAYLRFVNPMDLRVAERVCGECHGELIDHLMVSLHGTTAAHLSDGFFENGLQKEKDSRYSVFPVAAPRGVEGSTVERLLQPPKFDPADEQGDLAAHFPDLVRKECMQCHLWSQGRALRGRVGFDGEYRGAGCAACHVPYRADGLSESADRTAKRVEPGHPPGPHHADGTSHGDLHDLPLRRRVHRPALPGALAAPARGARGSPAPRAPSVFMVKGITPSGISCW